jgi:hypothetical protein
MRQQKGWEYSVKDVSVFWSFELKIICLCTSKVHAVEMSLYGNQKSLRRHIGMQAPCGMSSIELNNNWCKEMEILRRQLQEGGAEAVPKKSEGPVGSVSMLFRWKILSMYGEMAKDPRFLVITSVIRSFYFHWSFLCVFSSLGQSYGVW